jgi:hypothetical protein
MGISGKIRRVELRALEKRQDGHGGEGATKREFDQPLTAHVQLELDVVL